MTALKKSPQIIELNGITIELRRKTVKALRLVVFPSGAVRMTAPAFLPDFAVQAFMLSRLNWVRKQQARFLLQPPPLPQSQFCTGEQHFFQGVPCQLNVTLKPGVQRVVKSDCNSLQMSAHAAASVAQREALLDAFYRAHLQRAIPLLIAKWQNIMQVQVADWGIRKMKTRWGSCNIVAHRISLNLALAKYSPACLEYVLVHEMVHLFERYHNAYFYRLMDQYLPLWRELKRELNRSAGAVTRDS